LEKAIDEILTNPSPHAPRPVSFSVIRVPFFLEPHYDESKPFVETNRQRLIRKWGGKEGWERQKLQHNLKGRGEEAGIPHFNLDRLTSNTMASHRLIQHVGKSYGLRVSEGLYDRLNVYYFVDGHSLNDRERLARVTHECIKEQLSNSTAGEDVHDSNHENCHRPPIMSEEEILNFLNSNQGRLEIELALQTLDQIGIHSIPKFIIEGRRLVDGAANHRVFVDIFREIEESGKVFGGPIFADILGVGSELVQKGSHSFKNILQ
jgi:Predicted dithiol-disulfide isomerase involved in polyketide biosynthesis